MPWGKEQKPVEKITCSLVCSPKVYLEPVPKQKLEYLMEEYPSQEWLAYMKGRISKEGNFHIEDLYVPPHASASGGSAEAEPFTQPKNCLGVMHSHHHMGAFHSGTDDSHVDRNYPLSITVAFGQGKALTFSAISFNKTPCGKELMVNCTVFYVANKPLFNKEAFLSHAKKNIEKGKPDLSQYYQGMGFCQDTNGVYVYGKDNYIPAKYRIKDAKDNLETIVTDKEGHVLGKEEVQDLLANSTPGD
jgi:hypothetical protein